MAETPCFYKPLHIIENKLHFIENIRQPGEIAL